MAKFLDDTGLATFWAKIKSLVTGSIQALDVSSVGGAGKYISAISETDGKISATATTMDTTPTANSTNAVTSGGIKTALDAKAPSAITTNENIATGDRLLFSDYSDSGKIKRKSDPFDTSITDTFLSRDGTFATVKEADLAWGGNFRPYLTPVEIGIFPQNLLANALPEAIKFEKSDDGGTTWTEVELAKWQKLQLFNLTSGIALQIGGTTRDPELVPLQRGRITIGVLPLTATEYATSWFYGNVKRILILSNGSGSGPHCVVETQNGPDFLAHNDVWTARGDYAITGDPGWNSIPYDGIIGGYDTQLAVRTCAIRFTFWNDAANSAGTSNSRRSIIAIGFIPSIVWLSRGTAMAKSGFPVVVNNDGTGLVEKANGLTTARKLKTNLARTADSTFDGSADQLNIPVTGQLPDANIASASTWNAKQSALPTSGTASTTYAINVSGGSASCTGNAATATAFSSGTSKTKFDGISEGANKVEASSTPGDGTIKIDGTSTTVYTHPSTTAASAAAKKVGKDALGHVVLGDALAKGDVGLGNVNNTAISVSATNGVTDSTNNVTYKYTHPTQTAYTSKGSATKVPQITTDSTGHVTGITEVTISGVTPASHTHTADAADVVGEPGNSTITDSTDIITTHINGYSSTNKKLYRRNFKDYVWPWIKDKISSVLGLSTTGYTGNAATATKATQDSDGNAINATYFKSSGNTTLVAGASTKIGTQNGADVKLTLPAHQDISGKMATDGSNATSAAGGNIIRAMTNWNNINDDEVFPAASASSQGKYSFSRLWAWIKGKGLAGFDTNVFTPSDETTRAYRRLVLGKTIVLPSSDPILVMASCIIKVHVNYKSGNARGMSLTMLASIAYRTASDAEMRLDVIGSARWKFDQLFPNLVSFPISEDGGTKNVICLAFTSGMTGTSLQTLQYSYVDIIPVGGSNGFTWMDTGDNQDSYSYIARCVRKLEPDGDNNRGLMLVNNSVESWLSAGYDSNNKVFIDSTSTKNGVFVRNGGSGKWMCYSDRNGNCKFEGDADTVDGYHIVVGSYSSSTNTISLY